MIDIVVIGLSVNAGANGKRTAMVVDHTRHYISGGTRNPVAVEHTVGEIKIAVIPRPSKGDIVVGNGKLPIHAQFDTLMHCLVVVVTTFGNHTECARN